MLGVGTEPEYTSLTCKAAASQGIGVLPKAHGVKHRHEVFMLGARSKQLPKPKPTQKRAEKRPSLGYETQLCESEEELMTCSKEHLKHPRLTWETQVCKTEIEEQMPGWKEEQIDELYDWHPHDWPEAQEFFPDEILRR